MSSLTLIDATDLQAWAIRRDAQEQLPELVRRLIHGTVRDIERSAFPSGESVQLGGWDGRVAVREGNAFVPSGVSVWEMGTTRDVKGKADGDYDKRCADPLGIDPAQSTFIFVTPRRWISKGEWERERRAENVWREVRAYDSEDLAEWLELAPAVHIAFSIRLGKRPEDAEDLSSFWETWATSTIPPLPAEFVTAGREEQVEAVRGWLRSRSARPLSIRAESREESLAFFAAAIVQLPAEERATCSSRTVLVRSRSAWNRLSASEQSLILVLDGAVCESPAPALQRGHQVVIPLGRADVPSDGAITLPRLGREGAREALITTGVSSDDAHELVKIARRSLRSFRRRLAVSPELQQPRWAAAEFARQLVPALLAGAWSDQVSGDREVLVGLSGNDYETWARSLEPWVHEPDSPVQRIGPTWFLSSREDAWANLSRFLTYDDVKAFCKNAVAVLCAPDPRFDHPVKDRWAIRMLGRAPMTYSETLVQGTVETLAISAVREAPAGPDFAGAVVEQVLAAANKDWRIWATLSRNLHLLAEAAPDVFLQAVEDGLKGEQPVLGRLFEAVDVMFEFPAQTGLLWALDTLAWSPAYLGRVAQLLLQLSQIDGSADEDKNQPLDRLRDIFLPWHPQTSATLEQRLRVLDALRIRDRGRTWIVMKRLISSDGTTHDNHLPDWREWADRREPVYGPEYSRAIGALLSRMVQDARLTSSWGDLVELLDELSDSQRNDVLNLLEQLDPEDLELSSRETLERELIKLLSHHRSYAGERWALPKAVLDRLESIYRRIEIQDPLHKCVTAFASEARLIEGLEDDWNVKEEKLAIVREQAVLTLLTRANGDADLLLQDLRAVADRLEEDVHRDLLGYALGRLTEVSNDLELRILEEWLGADESHVARIARGFGAARAMRDPSWLEETILERAAAWAAPKRTELLLSMRPRLEVWTLARRAGPDTEACYWQQVKVHFVDRSEAEHAITSLLDHRRPLSAISLLSNLMTRSDGGNEHLVFAADALDRAVTIDAGDDKPGQGFAHRVSRLLDRLASAPEVVDGDRAARFEWALMPVLKADRRPPRAFHRVLARDHQRFVELIATVYGAEDAEPGATTDADSSHQELTWWVLDSWRTVPDSGTLRDWTRQARAALAAEGRLAQGDAHLGEMLSGSPLGDDGAWPHEVVRDVIEEVASEKLERGFSRGTFNSRGASVRRAREGGVQERELAARYEQHAAVVSDRWPRTAAVLRNLAASYAASARGEDAGAEWDDLRARRVRAPRTSHDDLGGLT